MESAALLDVLGRAHELLDRGLEAALVLEQGPLVRPEVGEAALDQVVQRRGPLRRRRASARHFASSVPCSSRSSSTVA